MKVLAMAKVNMKFLVIFLISIIGNISASSSEEDSYETDADVIIIEPLPEPTPTPNDEILTQYFTSDDIDIVSNNTRCSHTQLSFTKETLLHIWEIKGLIGYISYIKRFDQPFEVSTDHVSFKSDHVDGKWIFKMHKIRHHNPFSLHTSSSSASSTVSSSASASFPSTGDVGDIRIVATYSYEARQPKNSDFIIYPTIIHGDKEIALPPQKSTSPTIVQQKFYNNRGFQLNNNFLEYVYTFSWNDLIRPLNNIKNSIYNMKYQFEDADGSQSKPSDQSSYYVHQNGPDASEELFEEITRTDFSGHFGDVTIKFVISAFFPQDPVSVTSSRCNTSVLELVSNDLLEKLTPTAKHMKAGGGYFHKDISHNRFIGHKGIPPFLRYSNSMLHDDRFADVILVIGPNEIPAHRIILATSSPVFSAVLENTTTFFTQLEEEPVEGTNQSDCGNLKKTHELPKILIEPQDVAVECVLELLRYIYTGAIDNLKMKNGHLAHGLVVLSDRYGFPELKRYCERILLEELTPENAIEMYVLGTRVSSHKITRKALITMKLNKAKLASQTDEFRDLSMRHPTLMYELFMAD